MRAAKVAWAVLLCAGAAGAQALPQPALRQVGSVETAPAPREDQRAPVRVGLMLGIVSTPRPVGAELLVRLYDLVGLGVSYSALPKGLGDVILSLASVPDASIEASGFDGEARVYPFRGSFFLGSALGRQSLTASATRSGRTVSVDMTTIYATPRLGWLYTWSSGFSLGFDAGVQLPLSTDVSSTSTDSEAAQRAGDAARAVGNTPLPSVNLRLGFFL